MRQELLFNRYQICGVLEGQAAAVKKHIQEIPANVILGGSEADLAKAVTERFWLNVPEIKEDDIHIGYSGEEKVDVSGDPRRAFLDPSKPFYITGSKTVIVLPFDGDAEFFQVQPQTYTLNPPRGEVLKGEVHLTFIRTDHDGNAIKQEYLGILESIKNYLRSLSQSAASFNSKLEGEARSQIQARKARLLADAGMTAAIGLPMKKRQGAPTTYAVPVNRRAPRIDPVKVTGPFTPEPALSPDDYEEILRIINNMVTVMELSPHAFHDMGEEDLRSHFLVQLNGAFEGQATGETFNFQGKTDILIRVDGRNVFIAECKFWKGEKAFLATIDQLLSYLSWRDTKAAVMVFSRNADFTAVLGKIKETAPKHPQFKRDLGVRSETAFRYAFAQPNDQNREILLTVMAFDIPTAPAEVKALAAGQTPPHTAT